jgi:hypothetical protein
MIETRELRRPNIDTITLCMSHDNDTEHRLSHCRSVLQSPNGKQIKIRGKIITIFFRRNVPVLLGLLSNMMTPLGTRCGRANLLSSKSQQVTGVTRSQRMSPSVMFQVLTGELLMSKR